MPASVLAGVFLIALSALTFEVALTRAFSVLLRYHFVFLAISLATCGLGVGGLLDFLWLRGRSHADDRATLSALAGSAAVCFAGSIALLFSPGLARHLTSLAVVGGICIVPFIFVGGFLSHAFAVWSRHGGRMYFYDLTGAALGSCGVIIALQLLGATGVPFLCAGLAAIAAAVVAPSVGWRAVGGALAAGAAVAVALSLQDPLIDLPRIPVDAGHAAKPLFQELADPDIKARIVHTEWNAFARTDVVQYARPDDGQYHAEDDLYVYTDGEVPTNLIHFEGDLDDLAQRYERFIGFFPFRTGRPDDVLLIGPGAGLDVLLAQAVGAERIEGAELNPSMLPIVRRFRDFVGPVYDYSNVHLEVAEGRSYVRRSQRDYDLIYMALTKTATTAASSLALVESYVHTVEGFGDYLDHLTERGQLAIVCQHPLVLARLVLTGYEALAREGVPREQVLRHIVVLSVPAREYALGPYRHMVVVFREPLTAERSAELAKTAIALGLVPVYFPDAYDAPPFGWLQDVGMEEFVQRFDRQWWPAGTVDVSPRTDDRPFVIDFHPSIPPEMARFVGAIVLAVLLFGAGTIVWLTRTGSGRPAPLAGAVFYFMLLGAGYMLVEVVLAQKLILYLGYPALTLSVILFSLLVGSGAGSLYSQAWPERRMLRSAAISALVVCVAVVVLLWALPAILSATLAWNVGLRSLVTMAVLLPLGFAMGMPFPTGLREVGEWAGNVVPWAWGINGVASVLGSVSAMLAAKLWGFQTVLLGGAAVYAMAFALAAIAHRYHGALRGRT